MYFDKYSVIFGYLSYIFPLIYAHLGTAFLNTGSKYFPIASATGNTGKTYPKIPCLYRHATRSQLGTSQNILRKLKSRLKRRKTGRIRNLCTFLNRSKHFYAFNLEHNITHVGLH